MIILYLYQMIHFFLNSLFFPRAHDLCHYVFGNSPWNHYLFRDFTLNLLSFFANSLLINYSFRYESRIFLANYVWIHNDSRESLFCVFTIFFAISLITHNIFPKIIILSTVFLWFHFSLRIQYKSSIFIGQLLDIFENPLWIH